LEAGLEYLRVNSAKNSVVKDGSIGEKSIYEASDNSKILDEILSIAKTDLQIIAKMCPSEFRVTETGFLIV
jgi:hypothetical protein